MSTGRSAVGDGSAGVWQSTQFARVAARYRPRVALSNGRSVADPFFNVTYPLARKNDVNIIRADDAHQVNLRVQKTVQLTGSRSIEVSGDVFNLFNSAAATDFLSKDIRSSLYNQPTNYVPARVGQIGLRVTF